MNEINQKNNKADNEKKRVHRSLPRVHVLSNQEMRDLQGGKSQALSSQQEVNTIVMTMVCHK